MSKRRPRTGLGIVPTPFSVLMARGNTPVFFLLHYPAGHPRPIFFFFFENTLLSLFPSLFFFFFCFVGSARTLSSKNNLQGTREDPLREVIASKIDYDKVGRIDVFLRRRVGAN